MKVNNYPRIEAEEKEEMKRKKGEISSFWGILLIILLTIISGAVICWFVFFKERGNEVVAPPMVKKETDLESEVLAGKNRAEENKNSEFKTYRNNFYGFCLNYPADFDFKQGKSVVFYSPDFDNAGPIKGAKIELFFDANQNKIKPKNYWSLLGLGAKAIELKNLNLQNSEGLIFKIKDSEKSAGALISADKIMYRFELTTEKNQEDNYFQFFKQLVESVKFD